MFEQSVPVDSRASKPLSFVVSASLQIVAVTLLVVIPLTHPDVLPGFHWQSVSMTAPLRRVDIKTVTSNRTGPVTILNSAPKIWNPTTVFHRAEAVPAGLTMVEPPGVIDGIGEPTVGRPGIEIFIERPPVKTRVISDPVSQSPMPIRVSIGVQQAKLIHKVIPVYPTLAKNARIFGVVHLVGIIAKDGTIRNLQLISGHPMLSPAALEAVRQWVYLPTLLNGEPVEVIAPIDVNFTLSER
jgi:periplasmic protein TonB